MSEVNTRQKNLPLSEPKKEAQRQRVLKALERSEKTTSALRDGTWRPDFTRMVVR